MRDAYIIDAIRTPIGRYAGGLSSIRADDLAALPIKALLERNTQLDPSIIEDVIYGCANQAGEDGRNVARFAALLADLPISVSGTTINRLCGSGMESVAMASRILRCGEAEVMIAGGVESMSRAPFVMSKSEQAFDRAQAKIYDTTIGGRFPNNHIKVKYGLDTMPETAENVAEQYNISREDQDKFALRSQQKAAVAISSGRLAKEITPVTVPQRKGDAFIVSQDEHPRETTLEKLAKLSTPFKENGTVTAGNASGVNDGACALLLASTDAVKQHNLIPRAKIIATATTGVEPRIMGIGPITAIEKVLRIAGLSLEQIDIIELNEAFAAQALAVTRSLGLADDDPRINPNGGAIALGHPLGMSGARLVTTAINELEIQEKRYALCSMCVGFGQGIAMVIERVS